jgi:transcriptional regulator with XRE-family HTH domain
MEKKLPLSARHQKRLSRFLSKDYRDAFLETDVKAGIAYQIQALREKTGLSQAAFAEKTGKKQSVISRLEDTEYGGVNVNTLLEIAKALDIGLQVRFCDYIDVLERDISPAGMKVDTIFETLDRAQTSKRERSQPTDPAPRQRVLTSASPSQKSPARRRGAGS